MGVYYYSHLGPYIEAKRSIEDVTKTQRSCTNIKCKKHTKHVHDSIMKFCTECGSPIGDVTYKAMISKVSAWEIAEKHSLSVKSTEHMKDVPDDTDIFVGNAQEKGRKKCCQADEERLVNVTPQLIWDEMITFSNEYKVAIKALYDAYGEKNVTVKWGLIQYGS